MKLELLFAVVVFELCWCLSCVVFACKQAQVARAAPRKLSLAMRLCVGFTVRRPDAFDVLHERCDVQNVL